MNCQAAALAAATRRDVEAAGGPGPYREHALASLRLKTVVKESHGGPVLCVAFNHADEQWRLAQRRRWFGGRRRKDGGDPAAAGAARPASASAADDDDGDRPSSTAAAEDNNSNLVATVGGGQVTVYDDRHMGDYVAVVIAHAGDSPTTTSNNGSAAQGGGNDGSGAGAGPGSSSSSGGSCSAFATCAWVSARGWTPHPHGDAVLAVAGHSGVVSVLSVVEAAVVAELDAREAAAEEEEEGEEEEDDDDDEAAARAAAAASQGTRSGVGQAFLPSLAPVLDLSSAPGRPGLLLALGGGSIPAAADADDASAPAAMAGPPPPPPAPPAPPAPPPLPLLTLWDVPSGRRLALFSPPGSAAAAPLTCAALHPEARAVVAGDARGRLWAWRVPRRCSGAATAAAAAAGRRRRGRRRPVLVPSDAAVDVTPQAEEGQGTAAALHCLRFSPLPPEGLGELEEEQEEEDEARQAGAAADGSAPGPPRWALAAKAADGRVFVLEWPEDDDDEDDDGGEQDDDEEGRQAVVMMPVDDGSPPRRQQQQPPPRLVASWRVVPAADASAAADPVAPAPIAARCAFGATPDGRYIAVGGPAGGGCLVFEARTGRQVSRFELPAGGNGGGGARRAPPGAAAAAAVAARAVALSGDGRHALVAAGSAGWVLRYEARRGCGAAGAAAAEAATAAVAAAAAEAQNEQQEQQQLHREGPSCRARKAKRGRSSDVDGASEGEGDASSDDDAMEEDGEGGGDDEKDEEEEEEESV